MSTREEIEAALAEAQARLGKITGPLPGLGRNARLAATRVWLTIESNGCTCAGGGEWPHEEHCGWEPLVQVGQEVAEALASIVNREQRAIDHARDVLARHRMAWDHNGCDPETGCEEECARVAVCGRCTSDEYEAEWPCPEVTSLHALWVAP